ncbi:hypothetical protein [Peribacillus simplex]|uniref:hypothetical protein n=1 Tax=Peribacillus simplex TaxID=1478 RepID=UPI003D28D193
MNVVVVEEGIVAAVSVADSVAVSVAASVAAAAGNHNFSVMQQRTVVKLSQS